MKRHIIPAVLALTLAAFCSCGESAYEKHSETDELKTTDTGEGLQTGQGTESIADPNAANTKRTPIPLESVTVDTTNSENK